MSLGSSIFELNLVLTFILKFSFSVPLFIITVGHFGFSVIPCSFLFQVVILDYKSIICPGKTFVMHLQAIIEEITLKILICLVSCVLSYFLKLTLIEKYIERKKYLVNFQL